MLKVLFVNFRVSVRVFFMCKTRHISDLQFALILATLVRMDDRGCSISYNNFLNYNSSNGCSFHVWHGKTFCPFGKIGGNYLNISIIALFSQWQCTQDASRNSVHCNSTLYKFRWCSLSHL